MMNEREQREYVEQVDELRRLQTVTSRPPSAPAARALKAQAEKVDALTKTYLDRFTAPEVLDQVEPIDPPDSGSQS